MGKYIDMQTAFDWPVKVNGSDLIMLEMKKESK